MDKKYKDLDLTFNKHPITKDISVSYDEQAVIRSMRNLLLTQPYEKPFNPMFGSRVRGLLFELVTPLTSVYLREEIEMALKNYEPRIKIQEVNVNVRPDYNSYDVSVTFAFVNTTQPLKVDFVLTRLR